MKYDPYTKEYQCECCGVWIDKPGICEDCKREIDGKVEEYLLEKKREGRK